MANKKKKKTTNAQTVNANAVVEANQEVSSQTNNNLTKSEKISNKKQSKSQGANKPKNKKVKKDTPKLIKKVKETTSELKKVTWPSAVTVFKKTGIVLTVVVVFGLVLFGIDRLLAWLFELLTKGIA